MKIDYFKMDDEQVIIKLYGTEQQKRKKKFNPLKMPWEKLGDIIRPVFYIAFGDSMSEVERNQSFDWLPRP